MHDDRLALRVGAAMLIGIVAAGVLMLVGDVRLAPRVQVEIVMSHLGGLGEGADIQAAGRVIGEIDGIELARREGGVVLHASINRSAARMASINGEWFVTSKGVLGERYLEVGPPAGNAPRARPVRDGDVIQGIDPPQLDRLAAISIQNVTAMRALTRELAPEWDALASALAETERVLADIEPNDGAYARTWAAQSALAGEARAVGALFADGGAPADIAATFERGGELIAHARGRIARVRGGVDALAADVERVQHRLDGDRLANFRRAADHVEASLARADHVLSTAQQLVDLVATGRGTVGGFLHDQELRDFGKTLGKIMKRRGWEIIGRPQE